MFIFICLARIQTMRQHITRLFVVSWSLKSIDSPGANDRNWISIEVVIEVSLCLRLSLFSQRSDLFSFPFSIDSCWPLVFRFFMQILPTTFSIVQSLNSLNEIYIMDLFYFPHLWKASLSHKAYLRWIIKSFQRHYRAFNASRLIYSMQKIFLSTIFIGHFLDYSITHSFRCHLPSLEKY